MHLTKSNYYEFGVNIEHPVLNSSIIKHIYPGEGGSPEILRDYLENYNATKEEEKYKFNLEVGTLLHTYMEDSFSFVIEDITRPSETITAIVSNVFTTALDAAGGIYGSIGKLSDYYDFIVFQADELSYGKNWKDETRYNKVVSEGSEYFNFLKEKKDSHVLSKQEKDLLDILVSNYNESEYSDDGIPWETEVPILWKAKSLAGDITCKSLIDRLYIDINNRIVYLRDLKTSKDISSFMYRVDFKMNPEDGSPITTYIPGPLVFYKYYRQLAFYRRAVMYYLRTLGHDPVEFQFRISILAFETNRPYRIKEFPVPEDWLEAGDTEIQEAFNQMLVYHNMYAEQAY